jgi:hypothetical protein
MIIASAVVTVSSSKSIEAKKGLPRSNHFVAWIILGAWRVKNSLNLLTFVSGVSRYAHPG